MASIRYESSLVERVFLREYMSEAQACLNKAEGLNDVKPLVRSFEKDFARYIGVKHAVAVNSGSDALKMMLLATGVKAGDEVIVPDLTYQAVALAVVHCGAKPVPVDARRADLTMDPDALKKVVTSKTKALIAAHMFGRPCDLERISRFCRERSLSFLEDVCQAESSSWKKRKLGGFGDMAAFSFSYYKPLSSCVGGGGMVVFNDERYERIRRWMEDWKDDKELFCAGQRFAPLSFMDLMALRVKFRHLEKILTSRAAVKKIYEQELAGVKGLTVYLDRPGALSVAQNFVVGHQDRDALAEYLLKSGVTPQKPYTPLHRMKAYGLAGPLKFPVSHEYWRTALHLPLYSFMKDAQALSVARIVRDFCAAKK